VLFAGPSTSNKIEILVVAGVFIVFALTCALLIPRYRPEFPGKRLTAFLVAALVVFLAMIAAVEVFAKEAKPEGEAAGATETTTKQTGGGRTKTVDVSETEFKITLPTTHLDIGSFTFDVTNDGKIQHDLVIDGPGVQDAKTSLINSGQSAQLKVTLQKGTYDLYCSVPGHKQAGMDVKVTVA
jgi:uncharacterized cupredoxin-like copper-binding protein